MGASGLRFVFSLFWTPESSVSELNKVLPAILLSRDEIHKLNNFTMSFHWFKTFDKIKYWKNKLGRNGPIMKINVPVLTKYFLKKYFTSRCIDFSKLERTVIQYPQKMTNSLSYFWIIFFSFFSFHEMYIKPISNKTIICILRSKHCCTNYPKSTLSKMWNNSIWWIFEKFK